VATASSKAFSSPDGISIKPEQVDPMEYESFLK